MLSRRRRSPAYQFLSTFVSLPSIIQSESRPRSFPIEGDTPVRARSRKHLSLRHTRTQRLLGSRQPPRTPQRLVRLAVCSDTHRPGNIPHLDLPVQRCAEQILSRLVPVQTRNPRIPQPATAHIAHMLAMLHVIERNDPRIARGSKPLAPRRKGHSPHRLRQPGQTVDHPPGIIVKHIDPPVLMSASRQPAVRAEIDRQPKRPPTRTRASRLVCLHLALRRQVPHHDPPVLRRGRQEVLVGAQRGRPGVGLLGRDLVEEHPVARVLAGPHLELAAEAGRDGDVAGPAAGGADVVDAEAVGVGYRLDQGEGGGGGGGVDVEGGGARGGEEAGFGRGEGEDVRYMGWGRKVLAWPGWKEDAGQGC